MALVLADNFLKKMLDSGGERVRCSQKGH